MTTAAPNAALPKPRRRWYQFTLRTLLIAVTVAGCGLGWLGFKIRAAREQQAAIAVIYELGGRTLYADEFDADGNYVPCAAPELPGPQWLQGVLGADFYRSVQAAFLSQAPITDATLEKLQGLSQLRILWLDGTPLTDAGLRHVGRLAKLEGLRLSETPVTDAGLDHLRGLSELKWLSLVGTKVTAAGVAKLQAALPNCAIDR